MSGLQHSTREEANARCNSCAIGLSWVENYLFGNRCVLCAETRQRIGLINLVCLVILDWIIYNSILGIASQEYAPLVVRGSLGACGFFDINQLRTVKDRIRFLFELKRCAKRMSRTLAASAKFDIPLRGIFKEKGE